MVNPVPEPSYHLVQEIQPGQIERLLSAAADVTIDAAARPRLGAISFLHRFGSALNHHVHLHVCATDGVFIPAAGGAGCSAVGRGQALAIDADGNFYLAGHEAHTSGEAVAVIGPDGKSVQAMILDVPRNVSSLAVGDDTLYFAVAGPGRLRRVKIR